MIGYSRRVENRFFFELGVTRIILPQEWADKDDPLTWVTAEYTKAIETFVREDPTPVLVAASPVEEPPEGRTQEGRERRPDARQKQEIRHPRT